MKLKDMKLCLSLLVLVINLQIGLSQLTETSAQYGFYNIDNKSEGHQYGLKMSHKLNNKWGFEMGLYNWLTFNNITIVTKQESITPFGDVLTTTTTEKIRPRFYVLDLMSNYTLIQREKLSIEAALGYGFIKTDNTYGKAMATISPKMHLSKYLSISIPLSYGYIFWANDPYYSGGISLGYRY